MGRRFRPSRWRRRFVSMMARKVRNGAALRRRPVRFTEG
jgi:hypothetical protein